MKNFDESILTRSTSGGIQARTNANCRRKGLATLEMVLVLPFLMMLMATIVVFGYAATWKLRTETVARDAVWRARWTRFANGSARPIEWPEPGQFGQTSARSIGSYAGQDPLEHSIIAGPLPAINVDANVLDYTRGVIKGVASIQKSPPVFSTLTTYDFEVEHPIVDDRFQYHQMGISNYSRRFPVIYDSGMDSIRNSANIQAAVDAIVNSPSWAQLAAIDRDPEFLAVRGAAPDFYPRIRYFSSTDAGWVRVTRLPGLLRRIDRLPFTMGNATIRLYESQLEDFPELQQTIDMIRSWLNSLRGGGGGGSP